MTGFSVAQVLQVIVAAIAVADNQIGWWNNISLGRAESELDLIGLLVVNHFNLEQVSYFGAFRAVNFELDFPFRQGWIIQLDICNHIFVFKCRRYKACFCIAYGRYLTQIFITNLPALIVSAAHVYNQGWLSEGIYLQKWKAIDESDKSSDWRLDGVTIIVQKDFPSETTYIARLQCYAYCLL